MRLSCMAACKTVKADKDLLLGEYRGFSMTLMYNPFTNQYLNRIAAATAAQAPRGAPA